MTIQLYLSFHRVESFVTNNPVDSRAYEMRPPEKSPTGVSRMSLMAGFGRPSAVTRLVNYSRQNGSSHHWPKPEETARVAVNFVDDVVCQTMGHRVLLKRETFNMSDGEKHSIEQTRRAPPGGGLGAYASRSIVCAGPRLASEVPVTLVHYHVKTPGLDTV